MENPIDLSFCMGALLGESNRKVYAWLPDPTLVLKVEHHGNTSITGFQNVNEWRVWQHVEHVTAINMCFAPCVFISKCGQYLLQKRTFPMSKAQAPLWVPKFMTDVKMSNFGLLDDKPVAHDYGLHLMLEEGMDLVLKPARWLDLDEWTDNVDNYSNDKIS